MHNFLNDEALHKFNAPSSVNPPSLYPPAASADADQNQKEMEVLAGKDDSSFAPPAASADASVPVSNLAAAAAVDSLPPSTSPIASLVRDVMDCRLVISSDQVSHNIDGPANASKLFLHFVEEEKEKSIFVSVTSCTVILFLGVSISSYGFREIMGDYFDFEENFSITGVGFLLSRALSTVERQCLRYERKQAISTFCIVGLPYFDASWFSCLDSDLEHILCYSTANLENSVHKVLNIDFLRLLTPGRWIDSAIVNWYGRLLSQSCLPDVKFMPCDICDKLLAGLDVEDGMSAIDKYHGPFEEGRYVYPCFQTKHFTLSVLDVSKSRSRLASIDSLGWHDGHIRDAWEKFCQHRNLSKLSIYVLNGGQQGDNETECGVFCLINMELIVKQALFFDIKRWNAAASLRNCLPKGTCQVARNRYASLLRHQCLEWFRGKNEVQLHSDVYVPPVVRNFVDLHSDEEAMTF